MNNSRGFEAPFFDDDERDLITEFETAIENGQTPAPSASEQARMRDEWKSVLARSQKRKAVTLRLQERDITRIKTIAREMGMPYQTYLASVIHRIATGRIAER